MPLAIVISEYGAADKLEARQVAVAPPGRFELRLRQTCVGVNFHDVYVRSGLYKTLTLPGIPGIEGVGVVEQLGEGVEGFAVGDRVAYITNDYGSYAAERNIPASWAVPVPQGIDDLTAATVMLKGLTVEMLVGRVVQLKKGDWALVQAAAGGVGHLLVQAALSRGVNVIGTVGSPEKAAAVRALGCEHVIEYRKEDFVQRVKQITAGRGVDVAYDSVGKDTFFGSLECLALRGHLVNFGQSSGPVPAFEVSRLSARSATLTRPMLFHYTQPREDLLAMSESLFAAILNGALRPEAPRQFALKDAGQAHALLESRQSGQPLVLIP